MLSAARVPTVGENKDKMGSVQESGVVLGSE